MPFESMLLYCLVQPIVAFPGFIAVYIAGYELEVTKSWTLVFNQTGLICLFGWVIFLIFGTGKKIV